MVLFSDLPTNLGNRSSRFPHSHRHDYHGIIPKTSQLRDTHSEGKVKVPSQRRAFEALSWDSRTVLHPDPFFAMESFRAVRRQPGHYPHSSNLNYRAVMPGKRDCE